MKELKLKGEGPYGGIEESSRRGRKYKGKEEVYFMCGQLNGEG